MAMNSKASIAWSGDFMAVLPSARLVAAISPQFTRFDARLYRRHRAQPGESLQVNEPDCWIRA